jgi:hypothetical protein
MGGGTVRGFFVVFRERDCSTAYETICRFEPRAVYSWKQVTLVSPPVGANILLGKKLDRGRPQDLDDGSWSFRQDPVFRHGLNVVEAVTVQWGGQPFRSAPPDYFDWTRFFQLQMAYLLLWSAIERYSAFAFGPALSPQDRIEALGNDPGFLSALRRLGPDTSEEVSDSRNPGQKSRLDMAHPGNAAKYFYQVRSNLSHRGKGAWSDGEIVRQSLVLLLAVFKDMLSSPPML